jgi:RNA polymerase sigma factor for flagellar operon FliA
MMDRALTEQVVKQYLPMVQKAVNGWGRFLPEFLERSDLMQEGALGLLDAAVRFDPSKKVQFTTYAHSKIDFSLLDYMRKCDFLSRSARKNVRKLQETRSALTSELCRNPTDEEMAGAMGIDMARYRKIQRDAEICFTSVDAYGYDQFEDCVSNDSNPLTRMIEREDKDLLTNLVEALPTKESYVINFYYYEGWPLKKIGEFFGFTESRASQLHHQALDRLRRRMRRAA